MARESPSSFSSSSVRCGRVSRSISFSANSCAYRARPSFSSHWAKSSTATPRANGETYHSPAPLVYPGESLFRARSGTAALARTPALPEATRVGALSAHLRRSLLARRWPALDPERPFEVSPMNRWYAAECGRRRNGEIAPGATVPEPKLRTSRFDPNRSLHPATPYRRPTSSGPMRAIWPPRDG
jgi:hypothetical protein